jgi:hypothetical protein
MKEASGKKKPGVERSTPGLNLHESAVTGL